MRVERFYLFFPPAIAKFRRRRDRVRHRRRPLGGFVKISGMNPTRSCRPRSLPRLLPPAGLEADRDDRRRAGGEPADRLRAAVRARLRRQADRRRGRRRRGRLAGGGAPPKGDRILAVDGRAYPNASTRSACSVLRGWSATTSARASRPMDAGPRPGGGDDRARRPGPHPVDQAGVRRRGRANADRLLVRLAALNLGWRRPPATRRRSCGRSPARRWA